MEQNGFLRGKTALVTGGTRGIGRAIAAGLARNGARVVICGRNADTASRAAAELESETGGKVEGCAADVSNPEQVENLFAFFGPDRRVGHPDKQRWNWGFRKRGGLDV